jgi:thiamine biosynthesis lipoprotein
MKDFRSGVRRRSSLALLLFVWSCNAPALHTVEGTRVLMDTAVTLKIFLPDKGNESQAAAAIDAAFAELARLDSLLSSYRDDSEVASRNRMPRDEEAEISTDLDSLIRAAQYVSAVSDGAFDITIAPVLRLWGFGADTLDAPRADEIASRLPLVNFRHLKLRREVAPHTLTSSASNTTFMSFGQTGMAIDLGGIAKGYAADVAAHRLAQQGFHDILLAVGGDLHLQATAFTAGQRYIWIKHPRRPQEFFARFRCDNGGVSTSGDYERYFERDGKRYHHILDPATGFPAGQNEDGAQTVSVTVAASQTIYSDAFATAFFVMGIERGLALAERLPEIEAVFVFIADGKLHWRATRGLEKKLEIINTEL